MDSDHASVTAAPLLEAALAALGLQVPPDELADLCGRYGRARSNLDRLYDLDVLAFVEPDVTFRPSGPEAR